MLEYFLGNFRLFSYIDPGNPQISWRTWIKVGPLLNKWWFFFLCDLSHCQDLFPLCWIFSCSLYCHKFLTNNSCITVILWKNHLPSRFFSIKKTWIDMIYFIWNWNTSLKYDQFYHFNKSGFFPFVIHCPLVFFPNYYFYLIIFCFINHSYSIPLLFNMHKLYNTMQVTPTSDMFCKGTSDCFIINIYIYLPLFV